MPLDDRFDPPPPSDEHELAAFDPCLTLGDPCIELRTLRSGRVAGFVDGQVRIKCRIAGLRDAVFVCVERRFLVKTRAPTR